MVAVKVLSVINCEYHPLELNYLIMWDHIADSFIWLTHIFISAEG